MELSFGTGSPRRPLTARSESVRSQTHYLDRSYQSVFSTTSRFVSYETLRDKALARRVLFEDATFPTTNNVIQIPNKVLPGNIEWKRPHELSKRPCFIGQNPGHFNVRAGLLGDTWLLPAFSCLTLAPTLIQRCIPGNQAFDDKYGGIFRFRFWRCGEWIEVVIDDRLPTHNGMLLFTRNADPNEFWVALLEKAYAKLYGSYGAISGSMMHWALQDLTGGVADSMLFREPGGSLMQKTLDLAMARSTLLAATIAGANVPHRQFPNGLVTGRAYTVTGYAEIPYLGGSAVLVRLRNPWTNGGYSGPWSERSGLWDPVSEDIKEKLGYYQATENEFWMPYSEFSKLFTNLELCHLPPESWNLESKLKHRTPWKAIEAHRQWRKGYNAGGGTNSPLFGVNNQFYIELKRQACVVLSLMQKYQLFGEVKTFIACGCFIYQAPQGRISRLQMNNFMQSHQVASTGLHADRDTVRFFTLPAGSYVIVPITAKQGMEGKFCLRIFVDQKDTIIRELDDPNTAAFTQVEQDLDAETMFSLRKRFLIFSNRYEEIDDVGLRQILSYKPQSHISTLLCCEPEKQSLYVQRIFLTPDTCKAAIAIEDKEMNGRLSYPEFMTLIHRLILWQSIFRKYAVGNGSVIDSYSLRQALRIAGYSVSNRVLEALILRYAAKEFMNIEGFVNSVVKLHVAHHRMESDETGSPRMTDTGKTKYLQELLTTSIYS